MPILTLSSCISNRKSGFYDPPWMRMTAVSARYDTEGNLIGFMIEGLAGIRGLDGF